MLIKGGLSTYGQWILEGDQGSRGALDLDDNEDAPVPCASTFLLPLSSQAALRCPN